MTLDAESVAENDRKQVEEVSAMFGLGKRPSRESLRLSRKSLLSATSPIPEAISPHSDSLPSKGSSLSRNRSIEIQKSDSELGQENTKEDPSKSLTAVSMRRKNIVPSIAHLFKFLYSTGCCYQPSVKLRD